MSQSNLVTECDGDVNHWLGSDCFYFMNMSLASVWFVSISFHIISYNNNNERGVWRKISHEWLNHNCYSEKTIPPQTPVVSKNWFMKDIKQGF